jgi:hypothetical protein
MRSLRQMKPPSLPRHKHPLQTRLPIIAARAGVKDGDAKPAPTIAMRPAQPELQIENERIRRHPIPALQVASLPLLCSVSLRLNCLRKTCAKAAPKWLKNEIENRL